MMIFGLILAAYSLASVVRLDSNWAEAWNIVSPKEKQLGAKALDQLSAIWSSQKQDWMIATYAGLVLVVLGLILSVASRHREKATSPKESI